MGLGIRQQAKLCDQGQMVGKQVAVESVMVHQLEMVAEEQVVKGFLGSPGGKGRGGCGLFQDGVFQQRKLRIFLNVEVARQNGRNIFLANMLGNMADLWSPDWPFQAQVGDEQSELVLVDMHMGLAEKARLADTGQGMV